MVKIEIDGKQIQAQQGDSLLQVALDAGTSIPHFCYHKKLSITASCRMCLVEVEKSPRLLPACATVVQDGMVVHTQTPAVVQARKAVMEFLLINHPLDCPICDQGGECRLQEYAMHYGNAASRYKQQKRVVMQKNVGPLISMQQMQRCIHCTRCIRFATEIAGLQQLGMFNRGANAEVATFNEKLFDHELSGNVIDVCPVGALTSKPYLYRARAWELASHHGISPHDSMGSHLVLQTLRGKAMRVLPGENQDINECWLSDRDRFSYEALNSENRLQNPMIKQNNQWIDTDWETALSYVVHGLTHIASEHGSDSLVALTSAQATLEEMLLLARLMRGLGTQKIESRLHQIDGSLNQKIVPWLGMQIADISELDCALIIGSHLRDDIPLLTTRFRAGVSKGMRLSVIDDTQQNWSMPLHTHMVQAPSQWLDTLYALMSAVSQLTHVEIPETFTHIPVTPSVRAIAQDLFNGNKKAIFLGSMVLSHTIARKLHVAAQWLAKHTGATLGYLAEGANITGAWMAGIYPQDDTTLADIATNNSKAFVLLHTQPELDSNYSPQMLRALKQAEMVVCLSPFKQCMDYADVMLPIAAFAETAGTFINMEGKYQSFEGACVALGQTRPAWKVLRVLGNFLQLPGFEQNSAFEIRDEWLKTHDLKELLNNVFDAEPDVFIAEKPKCVRVAYRVAPLADSVVRHAPALSQTSAAKAPVVRLCEKDFASLGVDEGTAVRVTQAYGSIVLPAVCDKTVPEGAIRLDEGHQLTAQIGPCGGWIKVERL